MCLLYVLCLLKCYFASLTVANSQLVNVIVLARHSLLLNKYFPLSLHQLTKNIDMNLNNLMQQYCNSQLLKKEICWYNKFSWLDLRSINDVSIVTQLIQRLENLIHLVRRMSIKEYQVRVGIDWFYENQGPINNDDDQDAVMEGALLDAATTRRREFTEKGKEYQSQ